MQVLPPFTDSFSPFIDFVFTRGLIRYSFADRKQKNLITMKTFIKSTSVLISLILLLSFNTSASVTFNEESYIDDIPFDTEAIYSHIVIERNILDFTFEDEAYIDDIPFTVKEIAKNKLYDLALEQEFNLTDEAYIDDLPFNTEEVYHELNNISIKDTLSCSVNEDLDTSEQEQEITLKYIEQHSHIMRY